MRKTLFLGENPRLFDNPGITVVTGGPDGATGVYTVCTGGMCTGRYTYPGCIKEAYSRVYTPPRVYRGVQVSP